MVIQIQAAQCTKHTKTQTYKKLWLCKRLHHRFWDWDKNSSSSIHLLPNHNTSTKGSTYIYTSCNPAAVSSPHQTVSYDKQHMESQLDNLIMLLQCFIPGHPSQVKSIFGSRFWHFIFKIYKSSKRQMPSLTDYMDNLPLLFHPQLLSITHALPSRSLLIHPSCKCRHTYALVLYKLVSAPGCCDSTLVLIRYTNKPPLHAAHLLSRQCCGGRKKILGASC